MLTERSKVPSEPKKRDFFPAKNPVDARREVVLEEPSGYPAQQGLTWRNRQVTQPNQD
jgi:hypothetical protein